MRCPSPAAEAFADAGLFGLYQDAHDVTEWTPETVAPFLRAAYGDGYMDALKARRPDPRAVAHEAALRLALPM